MHSKGTSDSHSGMVALRSIDEHAAGWYRACGAGAPYTVAGAALVLHQTSHLIPAGYTSRAPEAGRILKRWGGKVNAVNLHKAVVRQRIAQYFPQTTRGAGSNCTQTSFKKKRLSMELVLFFIMIGKCIYFLISAGDKRLLLKTSLRCAHLSPPSCVSTSSTKRT